MNKPIVVAILVVLVCAGTVPASGVGEPVLAPMTILSNSASSVEIGFPTLSGLVHRVEVATDLSANWTAEPSFMGDGDAAVVSLATSTGSLAFIRYQVDVEHVEGETVRQETEDLAWQATAPVTTLVAQGQAWVPALHFRFDETGVAAANQGLEDDATLIGPAGVFDYHTADGTGASARGGDRALNVRGDTGVAQQVAQLTADLGSVDQFTISGWFRVDPADPALGVNPGYLFHQYGSRFSRLTLQGVGAGAASAGRLRLSINGIGHDSTALYGAKGTWVFFAVTYDGQAASNTDRVKWYVADEAAAITAAADGSDAGVYTIANGSQPIGVGNTPALYTANQVMGALLDDFRLYTGRVLSASDLEAVRQDGLAAPATRPSAGAHTRLQGTNAGDSVTFTATNLSAGVYEVRAGIMQEPNGGAFLPVVNGLPLGPPIDTYADPPSAFQASLGTVVLGQGDVDVAFQVTGKHPQSAGYAVNVDYLDFVVPVLEGIHVEAEDLSYTATEPVLYNVHASASAGEYLVLNTGADGTSITFTIPDVPAGTYGVKVGFAQGSGRGAFRVYFDGEPVGAKVDNYWADGARFTIASLDTIDAPDGDLQLAFRVDGKHPDSAGYALGIDYIELFGPPNYLQIVKKYADTLLLYGKDNFGSQHTDMLISILDRYTLSPFTSLPGTPGGIRNGDRCVPAGSNLNLQQNLLHALYALTEITGDGRYADAADGALRDFSTLTQSPDTKLYAWGEHMSWDLAGDTYGTGVGADTIHEPKRKLDFWDRLYLLDPSGVVDYARGLWDHQISSHTGPGRGNFSRHAQYRYHDPRTNYDFPKEASYFTEIWSRAYAATGDTIYLTALEAMSYRYNNKLNYINLINHSVAVPNRCSPIEMLSLAIESAAAIPRIPPGSLADGFAALAAGIDDGFLNLAHDVTTNGANGFIYNCYTSSGIPEPRSEHGTDGYSVEWEMGYGRKTDAMSAMLCYGRYRQLPDGDTKTGYRNLILDTANRYLVSDANTSAIEVWAGEYGIAAFLQLAAYRMTGDPRYLERAEHFVYHGWQLFWNTNAPGLPRTTTLRTQYEEVTRCDTLALAMLAVYVEERGLAVDVPLSVIDR